MLVGTLQIIKDTTRGDYEFVTRLLIALWKDNAINANEFIEDMTALHSVENLTKEGVNIKSFDRYEIWAIENLSIESSVYHSRKILVKHLTTAFGVNRDTLTGLMVDTFGDDSERGATTRYLTFEDVLSMMASSAVAPISRLKVMGYLLNIIDIQYKTGKGFYEITFGSGDVRRIELRNTSATDLLFSPDVASITKVTNT